MPPSVFCELGTYQIWPPDEGLKDVGFDFSATDDMDSNPTVSVSVFSNEDDLAPGSGNFSPDAKFVNPLLRLRAERSGSGPGRVYLVILRATDASGNSSHDCCVAIVPHDRSNASIVAVDAQALAAQSQCDGSADGTVPNGWYDVTDGPVVGPKQ